MKKLICLIACLACLLLLVGCGGDYQNPSGGGQPSENPPPSEGSIGGPLQGNWSATVESTVFPGTQTAVDLFIQQRGTTITSKRLFFGGGDGPCSDSGTVSGTVNGNDVTFTIQEVGLPEKVMVTANLSNGILTGTYTTSGPCTNGDAGNFSARLIPAVTSSSWSGETVSSELEAANFTATLNDASSTGVATGSITFSNSPCLTTLTITASQIGSLFFMSNDDIGFGGQGAISTDGKSIQGSYETGQVCGLQAGNFTMSTP